jgi:hypothetical protein
MMSAKGPMSVAATLWICVAILAPTSRAACPPFHAPLEDSIGVGANGGTITPPVSFAAAVKANGACVGEPGFVRYSGGLFDAETGSVSLWFKKSGSDPHGGILQIGQLGQAGSLGIFFNGGDDLFVELRTDTDSGQVQAPDMVSAAQYIHIVATWETRSDGIYVKLFVDGEYRGYQSLSGAYAPSSATLDVGRAGAEPWYGSARGCIDEVTFANWPLEDSEVYAETVYSAGRYLRQGSGRPTSTGPVQLSGGSLVVDGKPFTVKGVGYQPVPICSDVTPNTYYADSCIIERDIPRIRAMHANTVRLWGELPVSQGLLDALYNGGEAPIYAILGFWIDPTLDYGDPKVREDVENAFRAYVTGFQDHPAVLAWGIGNENNLAHSWPPSAPPVGPAAQWYDLANQLAAAAHEIEGGDYHPTMIINGGLLLLGDTLHHSDDVSLDHVDMWGVNAYPGIHLACYFDYYERISAKPLVITEFGIDAYDNVAGAEDQESQAEWNVLQWRAIRAKTLGGTVMAYSDEWWKAGTPCAHDGGGFPRDTHPDRFSNEEWWGIFSIADTGGLCDELTQRQAYAALQWEFRDKQLPATSERGVIGLGLLLLTAGTLVVVRRAWRRVTAPCPPS